MRCEEVQALASAWLDNELADGRAGAIAEHEAGCAACHAYVGDLRLLSDQMTQLGRGPAPAELHGRIRNALARERARSEPSITHSRWRSFVQQAASMAAVCLLSVFGTWGVLHRVDTASATQHDVVAAHVRSLLQNNTIQVVSSDQHTVRPWFNGRVEFAPPVKDLTQDGFPLAGGRLDYVDGHRVATLVYHRRLHTISVFVWPEAGGASAQPSPAQVEGLNVLSWTKDGMAWWAVSDLDPMELRELRALL